MIPLKETKLHSRTRSPAKFWIGGRQTEKSRGVCQHHNRATRNAKESSSKSKKEMFKSKKNKNWQVKKSVLEITISECTNILNGMCKPFIFLL